MNNFECRKSTQLEVTPDKIFNVPPLVFMPFYKRADKYFHFEETSYGGFSLVASFYNGPRA